MFHIPETACSLFYCSVFSCSGTAPSNYFFDLGTDVRARPWTKWIEWNAPSWTANTSAAIGRATKRSVQARVRHLLTKQVSRLVHTSLLPPPPRLLSHYPFRAQPSPGFPWSTVESIFQMLIRTLLWLRYEGKRQLGRSTAESLDSVIWRAGAVSQ